MKMYVRGNNTTCACTILRVKCHHVVLYDSIRYRTATYLATVATVAIVATVATVPTYLRTSHVCLSFLDIYLFVITHSLILAAGMPAPTSNIPLLQCCRRSYSRCRKGSKFFARCGCLLGPPCMLGWRKGFATGNDS